MDPINGLSQIMRVLRERLAQKSGSTDKTSAKSSAAASSRKSAAKAAPDEIMRRIGERIRALTPEERRGGKGIQVFVESVLAWEFGEELLQDPRFTEIAREVQASISENSNARDKLVSLLNQL
jgi:hypothetical protein